MAIPKLTSNILAPTPIQSTTAPRPKAEQATASQRSDTVKISASAKVLQAKTAASQQTVAAAAHGDVQAREELAPQAHPAHSKQ